jgi:hypothetical protein
MGEAITMKSLKGLRHKGKQIVKPFSQMKKKSRN